MFCEITAASAESALSASEMVRPSRIYARVAHLGKGGQVPAQLVALAVGEANGCEYCVSAHSALGKLAGLTDEELEEARVSRAVSKKDAAALEFAHALLNARGKVSSARF